MLEDTCGDGLLNILIRVLAPPLREGPNGLWIILDEVGDRNDCPPPGILLAFGGRGAREYGFCTPDRLDDRHWTQQANFHVQRRRARAVRCDVELDHRPSVKVLAGHQQARELKKRESRIAVCTLAWRESIDHVIFGAGVSLEDPSRSIAANFTRGGLRRHGPEVALPENCHHALPVRPSWRSFDAFGNLT